MSHAPHEVSSDRLYFVGVSTSGSSIMRLFPQWARHLGLNARIAGLDVALGAEPGAYEACIETIAADPTARGALVTSHKTAVFEAAGHLFTSLDPYASLCREVSCLAVRGSELHGWAKDPITGGFALDHMLDAEHWSRTGADVVCFGAGGAGLAITARLLSQSHRPRRLVLLDSDPRRTEFAWEVVHQLGPNVDVDIRTQADAADNDILVEAAPAGSLVINATGMGKDRAGSPLSPTVQFPTGSVVWDLNYRGELPFLATARDQAGARDLEVYDGWRYFLHGWTEVIAEVFDLTMSDDRFAELARIAERVTGRADPSSVGTEVTHA